MAVKRCVNGHYYDDGKHSACPHCPGGIDQAGDDPVTVKAPDIPEAQLPPPPPMPAFTPVPAPSALPTKVALPRTDYSLVTIDDDPKTIAAGYSEGFDPVVGWLVCTHGADRGRDYRIRSGQNFIGRSEQNDLVISGEAGVSRERHSTIVFEPKQKRYYLIRGEGVDVWVCGELLKDARELKNYDQLAIGEATFVFVALCGEGFDWE
jgi:hypothetical protein